MKKRANILYGLLLLVSGAYAQVAEPYPPLHGGSYSGPAESASPDPLITWRWDHPSVADSLQVYVLRAQKITGFPETAFKSTEKEITVLGEGSLMLDFGTESAGWLEFDSDDLGDSIEASISEYNEPAIVNAGAQHPIKTSVLKRYGRTYRLELNDGLYEGVRFAWIHVRTFSRTWHIKNIRLVCQVRPTNYKGSFSCNDTALTRIWYSGAYTVKLNLLQQYFGAILVERSDRYSWTGDAYPAQAASLAAFGNDDVVRQNLVHTSTQDNGIPAYSLYWVLSLIDYFNYTGDSIFLKQYAGNADQRLTKAFQGFEKLPALNFMGWDERLGAGFETPQIPEAENTYRMLCINAWTRFSKAMSSIRENTLAEKYRRFAALKTASWGSDSHVIAQFGVHAVSEAINAGLVYEKPVDTLANRLFADRLNRLSYSPFNQYFIIKAMAAAGKMEAALATIRDCWGGQLAYGGTTFFEVYRPSWNKILQPNDPPPNNQCGYTSLAHPWSAGVTQWLSENVLGIQPVNPGFKSFRIIPYLNRTLTQVKGAMHTPFGLISASFNTSSGACEVHVPPGTHATKIALPKAGRSIALVTVNGQPLRRRASLHPATGIRAVTEDSQYLYLLDVQPGIFCIQLAYMGTDKALSPTVALFHYPIAFLDQDSITSGHWKARYGKQGYVLFGYAGDSAARRLPDYVEGVTLHKNGEVVWDSPEPDPRVPDAPGAGPQVAAAIITGDPAPTQQTMTIDIRLRKNHPYHLSMYLLDGDRQQRRSAVEIFDLNTLELLAPVQMIGHYNKGKYLRFSFDRSIRIRINQVRGKNAAVSGLFFD